MPFYSYILKNPAGVLYKGSTDNLEKRLEQHNGKTIFRSFTAKRGPWKLIYQEQFSTREEAVKRERFFKTGKGRVYIKQKIDESS